MKPGRGWGLDALYGVGAGLEGEKCSGRGENGRGERGFGGRV